MALVVHRLPTRRELRVGAVIGTVLAAGYLAQTAGLTITSPGNAGVITGMFVVLTPLLNRVFGAPIDWWTWAATLVSLAALTLLTGGPTGLSAGAPPVPSCAGLFALQIAPRAPWSPGH